MGLADYYGRNALAASQVLAGFDEERIRAVLGNVKVGIAIGAEAARNTEGRALLDLIVRLVSRLYPTLVIRSVSSGQKAADDAMNLARRINPNIVFELHPTIEIALGADSPPAEGWKRLYVGSNNWNAFFSTAESQPVGDSDNPFGPGTAACIAAANVFRWVFQGTEAVLDPKLAFSVGDTDSRASDAPISGALGEIVLAGAGAIGNAAAWAFSRLPMQGLLHIVDHQTVDLGNLQRYVLAERNDEKAEKADLVARYFQANIHAKSHAMTFENFLSSSGYTWPRVILALDSSKDRRAAQASLPQWIANSWTQPGDLGVSTHDFLGGACVGCLYLADHALENEDSIIASALGISDQLIHVRNLLHNGEGVPRGLLELIASSRELPIDRLLPFESRPIRSLYTEGFCGGAVLPLGSTGTPRQEVHVPLAHQSCMAGLLLAAAAVKEALKLNRPGTWVTRIDLMRPLGSHLSQLAAKDSRGICICQDADYQDVYRSKYQATITSALTTHHKEEM